MNLPVTETTERLIHLLMEKYEAEPTVPDHEQHEGHELAEVSLVHYEWQREANALRLFIGARLTNEAIHYMQPSGT